MIFVFKFNESTSNMSRSSNYFFIFFFFLFASIMIFFDGSGDLEVPLYYFSKLYSLLFIVYLDSLALELLYGLSLD